MSRSLLVGLVVSAAACGSSATPTPAVVHHFDDNYEAARAEATRSKLPLVVEVWAPW